MKIDQLKFGIVLNYTTIALNGIVGILYTPYMLRMLGQSEYGLYSLVASVIAYLTVLDLGFGNAIIRYTAKLRTEGKEREQSEMFGMFFVLYLLIGIITAIIGFTLTSNIESIFDSTMTDSEIDRAKVMLFLLTGNLSITFPMSIFGSILYAYEKFVFPKIVNIARIIINTLVMVFLLTIGYKAIAMVVVQTVCNLLSLFLNYAYCKKEIHINFIWGVFDWKLLKEISIYSTWIFMMIIVDKLYWSSGQFVLGSLMGTVAVAILAVAIQLYGMYEQFSTAMSTIFLPKLTAMVANNASRQEISRLFIKTGRIQFALMSTILTGFIIFGKSFIQLWAGADYSQAYFMCLCFFVPAIIPLSQNLGIVILQARNQMKFRALCYLVISITSVFLQVVLVKLIGIIGCPLAISIALVAGQIIIMNIYYSKKQGLDIKGYWREVLKMSLIPSITCIIGVYFTSFYEPSTWGRLLVLMGIFVLIYIPLAVKFQLNKEEKLFIKNKLIQK